MAQIKHIPQNLPEVRFDSLKMGDVFRLDSGHRFGAIGLLMKIRHVEMFTKYENPYYGGPGAPVMEHILRNKPYNAVYIDGPDIGRLANFDQNDMVILSKVCELKTEF